jgi:hypothetical protein
LFKTCAFIMIKLLTLLFEICIQLFYHSKTFKKVNTIILKKAKKDDYIISKTYRFAILLNIMNKIMKSIMNKRIAWLTKTHRLLFDFHMKCRKNRSIESTLKFLTKQIHIVWNKSTNRIVILLSLDVIEAFDTITHERLIHDLRKRRISKWIIDWMINFLQNRITTLTMNRKMIALFSMRTKIFQKFSLFFVLYLFYNVDLLKMCDKFEINTKSLKYANDVNILIYDKSTNDAKIWNEYTSSVKDERFDTSSCSSRLNTNWFTSSKIQRSLTWQSRSKSNRARYNRKLTYEFWKFRSTLVWNEIRTYEKFKRRW